MMSPQEKALAKRTYSKAFEDLKKDGIPGRFGSHQLASLYAVASICYDDGNHKPLITDELFDRLCKWLYDNYDRCVAQGANKLDWEMLNCCSGHDTRIFVKPYHEIAEVFLGHACQCLYCRQERAEQAQLAERTAKRRPKPPARPKEGSDRSARQPRPRPAQKPPQRRGTREFKSSPRSPRA